MRSALQMPFALGLALFLSGCEARMDSIQGQVFVATKGGENVKLGGVIVYLVDQKEAAEHIRRRLAQYHEGVEAARARNAKLQASGEAEVEIARRPLRAQLVDLEAKIDMADETVGRVRRRAKTEDSLFAAEWEKGTRLVIDSDRRDRASGDVRMAEALASSLRQKRSDLMAAIAHLPKLPLEPISDLTAPFLLFGLPAAIDSAQTDADGRFAFKIRRGGQYALAAQAQRQLLQNVESYYWLVVVTEGARLGRPILLANSNLAFAGSPQSLIR